MESRAKLFGHPIHTMLIVFPLGLLVSAVIFDILYLTTDNQLFAQVAFYNISAGIIGGLLAAVFGIIDFTRIPGGTRAKSVGWLHFIGNLMVVLLFTFSWFIRFNIEGNLPDTLALLFSFAGAMLGGVTGWLGGELVNRLGVGVDPGANLNAPNSLSGQPPQARRYEAVPVTGEPEEIDEP